MRRHALALMLTCAVCGCESAPLLQFTALTPSLRQSPVAQGLTPSPDSIRIEAQFDRIEGSELLFGLEVWNETSRELEVDPAAFEYLVLLPDGRESPGCAAVDPELVLALHDQRTSRVMAFAPKDPDEVSGWQLIGDLLDLLTSGSRTEQEERDRELLRLKQAEDDRERRVEHQRALERLKAERETLVRERMRRTRLPVGERMTGRVAFPAGPLLNAVERLDGTGRGITRVDAPPDQRSAGLVLRLRIGEQSRDRRFRIRRY